MGRDNIDVSVVLPCYTDERIANIRAALTSLRKQSLEPAATIVSVDHNERLARLIEEEFDWVTVVLNNQCRGASATRNRGVAAVKTEFTAFLDDDELADPEWLRELTQPFSDSTVVGTGGRYIPDWPTSQPRWFPDQFAWAVGGSYTGLPTITSPVRNVWSGNMAVRTAEFRDVGGFRVDFGKQGSFSQPEDTDLCIRLAAATGKQWMYVPSAVILHDVPVSRSTFSFFVRRCFSEGAGKSAMRTNLDTDAALQTEFSYVKDAVSACLSGFARFELTPFVQSVVIAIGLFSAAIGFFSGFLRGGLSRRNRSAAMHDSHVDDGRKPALVVEYHASRSLDEFIGGIGDLQAYVNVLVLVRCGGRPVELLLANADAADIRSRIAESVCRFERAAASPAPRRNVSLEDSAPAALMPTVTVAICTRERPEALATALDSLVRQTRNDFRVLVVDNAPSSSRTREVVEARVGDFHALDYVVEPLPGLSRARNRALSNVITEVVAWIDDDEIADDAWLEEISRGFVDYPDAVGVSGSVVPAELETWAQWWFEQYGGHTKGRGFTEAVFCGDDMQGEDPLYPLPAFGAGANMAFRTEALRTIGGFDVALGAGTPTQGGEDTLAFSLLLLRGETVVYYPAALTRHFHRPDMDSLERQMYGYGIGLTAFYTALVRNDWRLILPLLRLAPRAIRDMSGGKSSAATSDLPIGFPNQLLQLKRKGLLRGPWAYLRARSHESVRGFRGV